MKRLVSCLASILLTLGWALSVSAANYPPEILLGYRTDGTTWGDNVNPHNLSANAAHSGPKAQSDTRICIFCHTPHGAEVGTQLWNRKAPATMGTFPLYNTAEVDAIAIDDAAIHDTTQYKLNGVDGVEYPNGSTKMCLSCHDGATAIGEMFDGTNIAMTAGNTYITASNLIFTADGNSGTIDFRTTHPVSFVYTPAVVTYIEGKKTLEDYDVPWTGSVGNWKDEDIRLDDQQRMQCTTCHDPHADTASVSSYALPFWANFDAGSGNATLDYDNTCNKCHISPDGSGSGGTGHPVTPLP